MCPALAVFPSLFLFPTPLTHVLHLPKSYLPPKPSCLRICFCGYPIKSTPQESYVESYNCFSYPGRALGIYASLCSLHLLHRFPYSSPQGKDAEQPMHTWLLFGYRQDCTHIYLQLKEVQTCWASQHTRSYARQSRVSREIIYRGQMRSETTDSSIFLLPMPPLLLTPLTSPSLGQGLQWALGQRFRDGCFQKRKDLWFRKGKTGKSNQPRSSLNEVGEWLKSSDQAAILEGTLLYRDSGKGWQLCFSLQTDRGECWSHSQLCLQTAMEVFPFPFPQNYNFPSPGYKSSVSPGVLPRKIYF